ncbi:MAG TPA: hypothetical protein VGT07_13225, partial [Steroidobacteraceae bacterium]|nr:hypothetical protein [Steroidobacteraceae bacterium]
RVKDMLANGQLDNQGALDMIEKSGAFSTPANRQDFLRQKLQAALSDPNSGIDLAALERQMTAAGMNWQIELATARANLAKGAVTSGRFVSVDPQTGQVVPEGTPGAIQVTSDAYFKASRAGAKPNIAVLQMQYRTAQSREAEARRAIRMIQTSLTAGATPQGKAELAQAQSDLQQALQDERSILRQIQDVQSGVSSDTGGAGAGSGVGAGAGPGTPAPGTPAPAGQADRIAAGIRAALQKGQTRAQVIGYLATHWGQIADGDKLALVNQGVITVAEYKRLGPVKGQLPGQSAAKVQPQQPVDPPVKAILASMQSGPGPLQQIGAAIGSAVGSAAHAIGGVLSGYGALPPFDVTNPTVRHDVLVLVKVWPRLNPAQRQQIARAKRLSPQQVSWLTAHAGQLVGAPR